MQGKSNDRGRGGMGRGSTACCHRECEAVGGERFGRFSKRNKVGARLGRVRSRTDLGSPDVAYLLIRAIDVRERERVGAWFTAPS
jgi:hypothetical protein